MKKRARPQKPARAQAPQPEAIPARRYHRTGAVSPPNHKSAM